MLLCDQWYLILLLQNDYDLLKSEIMVSNIFKNYVFLET